MHEIWDEKGYCLWRGLMPSSGMEEQPTSGCAKRNLRTVSKKPGYMVSARSCSKLTEMVKGHLRRSMRQSRRARPLYSNQDPNRGKSIAVCEIIVKTGPGSGISSFTIWRVLGRRMKSLSKNGVT